MDFLSVILAYLVSISLSAGPVVLFGLPVLTLCPFAAVLDVFRESKAFGSHL